MNKRFVAVLIFAFVVASGASLLLYRLMANRPQTAKAAAPTVKVVVAARDLEVGAVLKEEDLKLDEWTGSPPAGSTSRIQDVVGRGVTTAIFAREPLLESRLAPRGAGGGLAAMIPKGMRAVAIHVNEVVGVAGFVVPGMRVDVLISGTPSGGSSVGTITKTLLQNLEVLSAGQDFKKDAEGKPVMVPVVNLLVTPEQAEQLSLASNQTTIQLVLRNPLDREVAKTPGAAMNNLFTGAKLAMAQPAQNAPPAPVRPRKPVPQAARAEVPMQEPAPPRKEAPFVMEIISGTRRTEARFTENTENSK
jgi:pilus assembly protein CpaB